MARMIKCLEKLKIKEIDLSPQKDLTIMFESNYKFIAFCNLSYSVNEDYDINWELCSPTNNTVFKINNHFKELIELYY